MVNISSLKGLLSDTPTVLFTAQLDVSTIEFTSFCNTSAVAQQINFSVVRPSYSALQCAIFSQLTIDPNETIIVPTKLILKNENITAWASTPGVIAYSFDIKPFTVYIV